MQSKWLRPALVIFWSSPLALSFPSNQLQFVARYGGKYNIRVASRGDSWHYSVLPKLSRSNLCQTTRLRHVHKPEKLIDRRTWKNYWWADYCYLNSLPSCSCPSVQCFCLLNTLLTYQSVYFYLFSLFSLPLSLTFSFPLRLCLYYSAVFLSHLWIIDVYRFNSKNRTVLEVTNGVSNRPHPPFFKELESLL